MPEFNPGDRVVVNGNLVAVIQSYDAENNSVVFVANVGGGTDTTTAPISHTRLEHIGAVMLEQTVPSVDQGRDPVTNTELRPGVTSADQIHTYDTTLQRLEADVAALDTAVADEQPAPEAQA